MRTTALALALGACVEAAACGIDAVGSATGGGEPDYVAATPGRKLNVTWTITQRYSSAGASDAINFVSGALQ